MRKGNGRRRVGNMRKERGNYDGKVRENED
jgi:hypothetical protein